MASLSQISPRVFLFSFAITQSHRARDSSERMSLVLVRRTIGQTCGQSHFWKRPCHLLTKPRGWEKIRTANCLRASFSFERMQYYSSAASIKKWSELSSRNVPQLLHPGVIPAREHGARPSSPRPLLCSDQKLCGKQDREAHRRRETSPMLKMG